MEVLEKLLVSKAADEKQLFLKLILEREEGKHQPVGSHTHPDWDPNLQPGHVP